MSRTDRAEARISVVGEDHFSKLAQTIEDGFKNIERSGEKAGKSTEKVARGLDSSTGHAALLATGMAAVLNVVQQVAAGVAAVGAGLKEAAIAGAVSRQFDAVGLSLERIRSAAKGTVDDGTLRKWSIQMAQAGQSSASIEKIWELSLKVASSGLGAAKGITTTAEAFELFTDSIIGASDSDLEKIGVLFDMPNVVQKYAKETKLAGEAVDKTVESQRVAAFILDELAQKFDGLPLDKHLTKVQQVEAAHTNFWADLKGDGLDALSATSDAWNDLSSAQQTFFMGSRAASASQVEVASALDIANKAIADQRAVMAALAPFLGDYAHGMDTAAANARELADANYALAKSLANLRRAEAIQSAKDKRAREEAGSKAAHDIAQARHGKRHPGGGGGRSRRKRTFEDTGDLNLVAGSDPDDILGEFEGGLQTEADRRSQAARDAREFDRDMERLRREIAHAQAEIDKSTREVQERAIESLKSAQMDAANASRDMALSMVGSFEGIGESLAAAGGIIIGEVDRISGQMEAMEAAGLSSSQVWSKGAPGMIAASGKVAAAFVDDTRTQAAIMAGFEGAAAVASYASQDYAGGAMHTIAAGLYTAVAAGAFENTGGAAAAGAGGRQTRAQIPDVGSSPRDRERSDFSVVINLPGATVVGSDRRRLKRDLQTLIGEAAGSFVPT